MLKLKWMLINVLEVLYIEMQYFLLAIWHAVFILYTSASHSLDSGLHSDREGIQSGPASISYFKSTNYL